MALSPLQFMWCHLEGGSRPSEEVKEKKRCRALLLAFTVIPVKPVQ